MRLLSSVLALGMLLSFNAKGEESEFKKKLQEDIDEYVPTMKTACGVTVKINWTGGSLGGNPREAKGDGSAISTLCTTAIDATTQACQNEAVKKALSGVKTVQCAKGKGTMTYKKNGSTLILTIDPGFTANNPAGQSADLVEKMKKAMDT